MELDAGGIWILAGIVGFVVAAIAIPGAVVVLRRRARRVIWALLGRESFSPKEPARCTSKESTWVRKVRWWRSTSWR